MVAPRKNTNRRVALVAGVRTPLAKAGTALASVPAVELARVAMREVLDRAGWPADRVDEVVLGNVIMPADAANPARVAALYAGVPQDVPALTVQRNCASGMEAVIQGATKILSGQARAVLVGGAESMSNTPLLFPAETALPMGRLAKARTLGQRLSAIASLRPRHFKPEAALIKGLTDPTCGLIMGKTAEILAREFGLSRDDQDAFALRSHQRATEAIEAGRFDDAIVPIYAGRRYTPVTGDVGPRPDQTLAALAKLKPIFDRRDGTVTVGNACQVTDGAVALLLMDAELARAEGYEILATVEAWSTAGCDPARMGLGPVYATSRLLRQTGLSLEDFDLVEINEAFAAQVLACLKAMASDDYARQHLDRSEALGELDPDRLNVNGGAIALGHPVGATGARIVLEAALELRRRDARRALATLCVGGGQGSAVAIGRGEIS